MARRPRKRAQTGRGGAVHVGGHGRGPGDDEPITAREGDGRHLDVAALAAIGRGAGPEGLPVQEPQRGAPATVSGERACPDRCAGADGSPEGQESSRRIARVDFCTYVHPPHTTEQSSTFLFADTPGPHPKHYHGISLRIDGQWLVAERDGKTCRYPLTIVARVEP